MFFNPLLDPFYGVYGFGKGVTRILNRLLLVAEILAIAAGAKWIMGEGYWSTWMWFVLPYVSLLAIGIVNTLIRKMWNIVEVFIYGTADSIDIAERHSRRKARREERRERRAAAIEEIRERARYRIRSASEIEDAEVIEYIPRRKVASHKL